MSAKSAETTTFSANLNVANNFAFFMSTVSKEQLLRSQAYGHGDEAWTNMKLLLNNFCQGLSGGTIEDPNDGTMMMRMTQAKFKEWESAIFLLAENSCDMISSCLIDIQQENPNQSDNDIMHLLYGNAPNIGALINERCGITNILKEMKGLSSRLVKIAPANQDYCNTFFNNVANAAIRFFFQEKDIKTSKQQRQIQTNTEALKRDTKERNNAETAGLLENSSQPKTDSSIRHSDLGAQLKPKTKTKSKVKKAQSGIDARTIKSVDPHLLPAATSAIPSAKKSSVLISEAMLLKQTTKRDKQLFNQKRHLSKTMLNKKLPQAIRDNAEQEYLNMTTQGASGSSSSSSSSSSLPMPMPMPVPVPMSITVPLDEEKSDDEQLKNSHEDFLYLDEC